MSAAVQAVETQQILATKKQPVYEGGKYTFQRTHNMALVRKIVTHPALYHMITEQESPAAEDYYPVDHPALWYVIAKDGEEILGCYALYSENSVCWGIHCSLLPLSGWLRGRNIQATVALFEWLWKNTPWMRITAKVPAFNVQARRLAEKSGMIQYGVNVKSFPKYGALHDEILLGISRPGAR